jgi:hypothetical protein
MFSQRQAIPVGEWVIRDFIEDFGDDDRAEATRT